MMYTWYQCCQVSFERRLTPDLSEGEPRVKTVVRTLFGASNPYPQKKVMTFNKLTSDFVFNVSYGGVDKMREQERRWALFGIDSCSLTSVHSPLVHRPHVYQPHVHCPPRCLGPVDVMSATVEGVSKALENNSDAVSKGVKAHFEMNQNGVLRLNSVSGCGLDMWA